MARSIKSKRGMALRRLKRIRYGKKELIRLNNMLGIPNKEDQPEDVEMKTEEDDPKKGLSSRDYKLLKRLVHESENETDDSDVDKQFDEVMVLTSSKFLRRKCNAKELNENKRQLSISKAGAEAKNEEPSGEAVDESAKKTEDAAARKRNSKTLVDDFGSYPPWMNQKKIRALAKVTRVMNKKKKKMIGRFADRKQMLANAAKGKGKKSHSDSDDDDEDGEKKSDSDSDDVDEEDYASEVSSIEGNLEMETDEAPKTTPVETPSTTVIKTVGKAPKKKGNYTKNVKTVKKTEAEDTTVKPATQGDDTIETIDLSD